MTVLIVDDSGTTQNIMRGFLASYGFNVVVADNGRDAIDYLHANPPPSVILLDLNMPVMDGAQFRREQQRDATLASIPVILVSGECQIAEIALALDIVDFLPKPIDPGRLLQIIREKS